MLDPGLMKILWHCIRYLWLEGWQCVSVGGMGLSWVPDLSSIGDEHTTLLNSYLHQYFFFLLLRRLPPPPPTPPPPPSAATLLSFPRVQLFKA